MEVPLNRSVHSANAFKLDALEVLLFERLQPFSDFDEL